MHAITREMTIKKLGTLMLANTEIAAECELLRQAVKQRDVRIAELEKQLAQANLPANDNAGSNGEDRAQHH